MKKYPDMAGLFAAMEARKRNLSVSPEMESAGNHLEQTNSLNAPSVCPCINWARDADDTMREHHPRCAEGNPVAQYVSLLQLHDEPTRRLLLRQFVERHFPTAYNVITKGTER